MMMDLYTYLSFEYMDNIYMLIYYKGLYGWLCRLFNHTDISHPENSMNA